MNSVKEVWAIFSRGFIPYLGVVSDSVYCKLRCGTPNRARWFFKDGLYLCLGCSRRCSASQGDGFQAVLPGGRIAPRLAFAMLPSISASEIVAKKSLLTIREAAYCLACSERHVRDLVDTGTLVRHRALPLRVTSDSVREEMQRLDEQPF